MEQTETRGIVEEPTTVADQQRNEPEEGLRFDDPYWDDAFCSWSDPTMRTCVGC